MEDEAILDLYFARDERAVAETDRKYGGYCFQLANNILHNAQDAEASSPHSPVHRYISCRIYSMI